MSRNMVWTHPRVFTHVLWFSMNNSHEKYPKGKKGPKQKEMGKKGSWPNYVYRYGLDTQVNLSYRCMDEITLSGHVWPFVFNIKTTTIYSNYVYRYSLDTQVNLSYRCMDEITLSGLVWSFVYNIKTTAIYSNYVYRYVLDTPKGITHVY